MRTLLSLMAFMASCVLASASNYIPETSVAGFFPLEGSGRSIYDFNVGWRFHRGDVRGAEATGFDDSAWQLVSTPHTAMLVPAEASGGRNYQGVVWYRKHFTVPADMAGKDVIVYFEAIMGKQRIYVNGKLACEHFGGYKPISVCVSDFGAKAGEECLISVWADNSDDPDYLPGKPQYALDFSYHGGIYRDVWLLGKNRVSITDPIESNTVAGGGVFIHYDNITRNSADVIVDTEVGNTSSSSRKVGVLTQLCDNDGNVLLSKTSTVRIAAGGKQVVRQTFRLASPKLWSPDSPYLYRVNHRVLEGKVNIDGGSSRIGIRLVEFKGEDGLWLNGEPYPYKLMGANRHQDFAYVGNAMPNSQHWNDAVRLRETGCRIIRTAHYPQDPSFMDACDELGMFVIVTTPGWQFWNEAPGFAEHSLQNTRDMIRMDRNHPSVVMWEPILNETGFPLEFSLAALKVTQEEYPYPGAPPAAGDFGSLGVADNYPVVYGNASTIRRTSKSVFTREWGDQVDDWYAHNSAMRTSRSWGEVPMLGQVVSLERSYESFYKSPRQRIGGAMWHPFDHQRGYHPDPFWGGFMDCFRQPKYAYYLFRSQMDRDIEIPHVKTGPMVYIANEMTPLSPSEVTVFSNCDEVRLTIYGDRSVTLPVPHAADGLPNGVVRFPDMWSFTEYCTSRARAYNWFDDQKDFYKVLEFAYMKAEGIVDGKVVCEDIRYPSRRSSKLTLRLDDVEHPLVADGSDIMVVIAEVTDDMGNVHRLAKDRIFFTVEGEGEIIGDVVNGGNPREVEFGSAPALIRSTTKAGKIRVRARVMYEGLNAPVPAELEFESVPAAFPMCYDELPVKSVSSNFALPESKAPSSRGFLDSALQEVGNQQTVFGVNNN